MRRLVRSCAAVAVLVVVARAAEIVIGAQGDLTVLPVQGNVYALVGPGGNSTVQIGPEGPLLVDTQPAAMSARMLDLSLIHI